MSGITSKPLLVGAALLLLAGCASKPAKTVYSGAPAVAPVAAPLPVGPDPMFVRAQLLADILYEAKIAYEDNRLMSPAGNNAYDRYQEVLQLDPGNAVALEGIQEIVLRYIDLANTAAVQGKHAEAETLLGRAARLDPERPELAAARARLEAARDTEIETWNLDPAALGNQDLEIMVQLAEIAQHIMSIEATFLINARTDEEGRWIYKTMRDAVGGYRLRGNIDLSATPNILVTVPSP